MQSFDGDERDGSYEQQGEYQVYPVVHEGSIYEIVCYQADELSDECPGEDGWFV